MISNGRYQNHKKYDDVWIWWQKKEEQCNQMSAQDMSLLSTNLSGWAKLAQLSSQRWTRLGFSISNLRNNV